MLRKILLAALLVSVAGNGILWARFERAKRETATLVSEMATAANARLAQSLSHQAQSHAAREAELLRRLELSDQVTRDALERSAAAVRSLDEYKRSQFANSEDPTYKSWAETELPDGVADRLRELR